MSQSSQIDDHDVAAVSVSVYVSAPSVDQLADTGASCPELCVRYNVDIREFVVLACLHNLGVGNVRALTTITGLSATSTGFCLQSLYDNGLVRRNDSTGTAYAVSADGIALIRKARG